MKFILKYVMKYKYSLYWELFIKSIGTVMDLFLPYLLSYIIIELIPQKKLGPVLLYGFFMLIASVLAVVLNIVANRLASRIARDTTNDLRTDVFTKITSLSQSQIDEISIPSLISRMTTDTYNIHNVVGMTQRIGIRAPLLLICGIIITLIINVQMALVMVISLPLILIAIIIINKLGVPLFSKVQKALDKLVLVVRENVNGAKVVKALSKGEYEKNRFNKVNDNCVESDIKANTIMSLTNPIMNFIMNVGLAAVLFVGAINVFKGNTETANITAFLTYFTILLNALLAITRIFISFSKANASSQRIVEIMELKNELVVTKDLKEGKHYIEFNNVNFSYNKTANNLSNINFYLDKGESLGIIGSTGSGKSTIINLLMRYYDVTDGNIYVDNKNIKSYTDNELKNKFGVVFQNDIIFGQSILENIDFGRNIPFNDIEKAVINAQAENFIKENEGYSRQIASGGSNLSGGQRQRLLLSRAMAKKPDILILDDSSSALDYQTDQKVRSAIQKNFSDTTLIIVASRISAVKDCDKIIVLDDGKIMNIGSHEELLKNSEVYRSIKISQMGGEE